MVESLPCLWEIKKLDPLEAILAASSPICSKGLAAATFRLTVSQPMSAPGHGFWPGRRPRASIRAALSFAYKHWDLKNPFAKIEPPLQKEPQIHYLLLADIRRLLDYLKVSPAGIWLRPRIPPGQRPLSNRLPVR